MARPVIHHRSDAFSELFVRVRADLARVAMVPDDDVMVLTGSGTAAFEAGLLVAVPAGAAVLAIRSGKFGARWAALARRFGFDVVELDFDWGRSVDPEAVAEILAQHPEVAAVLCVHSETSTGNLNDIEAIARVCRRHAPEALLLVDCVTSLSVAELYPDRWGLDGVFSGSQKGLMIPPGLGFAWLSERAWQRHADAKDRLVPSNYLDLGRERLSQREGQTAFTPAVNLVFALEASLAMLHREGIEAVWARRERTNRAVLAAGEALGCRPFAERPSPAVAALLPPDGVTASEVVSGFASQGITIAGGHDHLQEILFRPSVVGYADHYDAITLAAALEQVLLDLGRPVATGQGVVAAMEVLREA